MKNALAIAQKKICRDVRLEDHIAELMSYGRPSMMCHESLYWSCTVRLNTDQIVSGAKVESGYCEHKTIGAAVLAVLIKCRKLNH